MMGLRGLPVEFNLSLKSELLLILMQMLVF